MSESVGIVAGLLVIGVALGLLPGIAIGLLFNIWLELKAIRKTLHEHAQARRHSEQRGNP
jgi:uncharacterized protein YneF (UPF0154 family)